MNLKSKVSELTGVGAEREKKLSKLGIFTVGDLIEYFPRDYKDRSQIISIEATEPEGLYNIKATITSSPELLRVKNLLITKIKIKDETGECEAIWFNQPYLKNYFKKNKVYIFTGKIILNYGKKQLESPEYELYNENEMLNAGRIVPIYSSTAGLSQKMLRGIIKTALRGLDISEDFIPSEIINQYELCSREFAIKNIHFPEDDKSFYSARRRLVFEELFITQLALFKLKGFVKAKKSSKLDNIEFMPEPFLSSLPFKLTSAQLMVLDEIMDDLKSEYRMNRLVQGDVGSGKTVIAMAAAYCIIKSGMQAALMVPTEVLAQQHFKTINSFFNQFGIKTVLLSGTLKRREKRSVTEDIMCGNAQMIIGTHALIQGNVEFCNLGLAITDEQHRFGVRQRCLLSEKGYEPHLLIMSATPIPRTLGLILYGDLDISIINQMPPGRIQIETYAVTIAYRKRIYNFIKNQIDKGRQAYIICAAIEKNEIVKEIESVNEYFEKISCEFLDYRIECLHGKMRPEIKQDIMEKFISGKLDIIIATTVIEVGINVPNATVMLIENAERFGLAQLHQLRGRVGRGAEQSYCVLVSDSKSNIYKERMKAMTSSSDGFYISELDLKLRGPGDFFGTRQHGLPEMKIANLYKDIEILKLAQHVAQEVYESSCAKNAGKVEFPTSINEEVNRLFSILHI